MVSFIIFDCFGFLRADLPFQTPPRQSAFFMPAGNERASENGQRPFHGTTLCQTRPKLN